MTDMTDDQLLDYASGLGAHAAEDNASVERSAASPSTSGVPAIEVARAAADAASFKGAEDICIINLTGNEKGLTGEANGYLEQVRAHARGTLADVLPKVESASQSVLRDAIRHERRVELALEPDRFYDLVRWGIAKEVLQAAGKNYQDKNALLPLPQTEIDKSNGVLVQNPDY